MSQGKGSARRPSFIPHDDYGRRYAQTFTERELANDYREHGKRLARPANGLDATRFPDRTHVSRETVTDDR